LDQAEPKLVYTTMTPRPYKGTHDLIEAVGLLRSRLPGVHVRIAGPVSDSGYSRHLKRLVHRLGLENEVMFLGQLSASQVDAELRRARTFVITSHIENSPNSLAEAQYVGTPCVASFAGGTVSMVQDGVNALCFPAGDAFLLSHALHRILTSDDLAGALSARGSLDAGVRNNAAGLVERQVGIYRALCAGGAGKELES
jgi:glycosyltransferase involved in cell wall biosynthesis